MKDQLDRISNAKNLYGRIHIREDMKELMSLEAKAWRLSEKKYMSLIFEHIFCQMNGKERYDLMNPTGFSPDIYNQN